MNIETVKQQGSGYLVNNKIHVPNSPSNMDYWDIQEWINNGGIVEPEFTPEESAEKQYQEELTSWKQQRQVAVDNIEVTYNNVVYQGDEVSQTRMSRAIAALPDDVTTIDWVAKDNSVRQLNKGDLQAILVDAGIQQSAIWNQGRPVRG